MSTAAELLASLSKTHNVTGSGTHSVRDTDKYFVIDPDTREIYNESATPLRVMQYDHRSEVYTFELPRIVEGHDMRDCDHIRLHYINVGANQQFADMVEMDDWGVNPDNPETIICHWTITRNATQYVGILSFALQYMCLDDPTVNEYTDDEGNTVTETVENVSYEWHTDIFSDVEVRKSLNNSEQIAIEYSDTLSVWYDNLFGVKDSAIAEIETALENAKTELDAHKELVLAEIPDAYDEVYNMADTALRNKANAILLDESGEYIFVDDSANDYVKNLKVYGKTTQTQTTGKQLINPINTSSLTCGITFVACSDGSIIVKGTATEEAYYIFDYGNVIPYTDTELIASIAGDDNVSMVVGYYTSDGTVVNDIATVTNANPQTFTYPAEAVKTRTFLMVHAGTEVHTIVYPMIRLASITSDTYEPYSGGYSSPSPNWPQDLFNIDGVDLSIKGKNLATQNSTAISTTASGITIDAPIGSSEVSLSGTATETFSHTLLKTGTIPPGTYTLSVDGLQTQDNSYDRLYVANATTGAVLANHIQTSRPQTFVVPYATSLVVSSVISEGSAYDTTIRIQIEPGDTATDYEAYTKQDLALGDVVLPGVPATTRYNYTAADGSTWLGDVIDFERGVHIHNLYEHTLDGSEEWYTYRVDDTDTTLDPVYIGFNTDVPYLGTSGNARCTFLTGGAATSSGYFPNTFVVHGVNRKMYVRVQIPGVTDITTFKEWLTVNPQKVVYELAKPYETALTDAEIAAFRALKTNYPCTTVLNEEGAHMQLDYIGDTNKWLPKLVDIAVGEQIQSAVDAWLTAHYSSAEGVSF